MAEENKNVPEVTEEKVDAPEVTGEQEKMLAQDEVNRLIAQNKSKAKDEAKKEYEEIVNSLRAEIEEIKLNSLPEKERKGYKQEQEEKKQKEYAAQLEAREKALETKEAAIQTKQELSESDIDSRFVDILLDTGVYKNVEDRVAAFKDIYNEARDQYRSKDLKEALSGKSPKINVRNDKPTKKFSELSYSERIELKATDPEKYKLLKEND